MEKMISWVAGLPCAVLATLASPGLGAPAAGGPSREGLSKEQEQKQADHDARMTINYAGSLLLGFEAGQ